MAGKKKNDHRMKNKKVNTQNNMSLSSEEEDTKEPEIKRMFANILMELKTLKEQNETFRNETKKDIEELKAEIKGIDKKMVERCGSLETEINYVENNTNKKVATQNNMSLSSEEEETKEPEIKRMFSN